MSIRESPPTETAAPPSADPSGHCADPSGHPADPAGHRSDAAAPAVDVSVAGAPRERLPRVESLTGLRWWAALAVFIGHAGLFAPLPWLHLAQGYGRTGVTFFFILSGFVLTWSRTEGDPATHFWWRRFARIVPAHVVATFLAIPVFYAIGIGPLQSYHREMSIGAIALSLVLLHGWSYSPFVLYGGNPASWSLACEMWFYAIFPAVVRPFARLRRRGLFVALALITASPWLVYLWQAGLGPFGADWLGDPAWRATALPLPIRRTWEFLTGIVIALLLQQGVRAPLRTWQATAVLTVLVLGLVTWGEQAPNILPGMSSNGVKDMVTGWGFALLIWAAAQNDRDGRRSWLKSRPMVTLGQWSYAFYLVHATIIYGLVTFGLFEKRTQTTYANIPFSLLFLGLSLLLAAALYRFVEVPAERRLRRMVAKPAGAPAAN